MGVSGSGKSTVGMALAEALGWSFIEGDRFHSPENVEKMAAGVPLKDEDRWKWLQRLADEIRSVLQSDNSAVLACSALKVSYRKLLKIDQRVQFVFLNVPLDTAKERLKKRIGHFMPASLIASQFETLEPPTSDADTMNVDAQQEPNRIVQDVVAKLQV